MIVVTDYDPAWPRTFALLRDRAWPLVAPFAESIWTWSPMTSPPRYDDVEAYADAKTDFVRACLAAAK